MTGITAARHVYSCCRGAAGTVCSELKQENPLTRANIGNREPGNEEPKLSIDELDAVAGGSGPKPPATPSSGIIKKRDELQMTIIRKM